MSDDGGLIPRTVTKCEEYLDFLADLIDREGLGGAVYMPIYERLLRERDEAAADETMLSDLRRRLKRRAA